MGELMLDRDKIKICCITGTRADYGIYRPLLIKLEKSQHFDLQLIVSGMHLLNEYGATSTKIEADNLKIIATPAILLKGDSTYAMSQSLGLATVYFADILNFYKPDFILILGDRGEMLAAAITAHYQNIGIIHLHGGEVSGSADDGIRQAISKLAHLHFVSSVQSKENLLKLGEEKWRIFPVGSLRKSSITESKNIDPVLTNKLAKKYQLTGSNKKLLIAMHPDSKEKIPFQQQIESLISALSQFTEHDKIFIGPNSDAGGEQFNLSIKKFISSNPNSRYYSSIPDKEYLFLLSKVDLLIGNSSSGIIEAPFFNLSFLNIGKRQQNREHANNVLNVNYDEKNIVNGIKSLLNNQNNKKIFNPYDLVPSPESLIITELKQLILAQNLYEKIIWKE